MTPAGVRRPVRAACGALLLMLAGAPRLGAADAPAPQASPTDETPTKAAPAAPAPTYRLAFRFEKGQVIRYEVTHDTEILTHYNDAEEAARNKSASRRSYKVVDVTPDGAGDLELSIDWVRMQAEFDNGSAPVKPIVFQSDDPDKHPRQFLHVLDSIGTPQATVRMSPSGRPLKVDRARPRSDQDAQATAASDASFESYLMPLPEGPVAVGQVWKDKFEVVVREKEGLPVRVTMQQSYKLAAIQDHLATIELRTIVLTPVQDPWISAQLIQRETSGKIVFDRERGLIISRESRAEGTVIGQFGPKSSTQAKSSFRERLLPDAPATASATDAAAKN